MGYDFIGEHIYADIYEIPDSIINDNSLIINLMREGIIKSGATCCGEFKKEFKPFGFTAVFILNESHASIHTYPEHNSMFVDIFTCGRICQPDLCIDYFITNLGDVKYQMKKIIRGRGNT